MYQGMNEYEIRAMIYWRAWGSMGQMKDLFSYLFWRDANEFGKPYAQRVHLGMKVKDS